MCFIFTYYHARIYNPTLVSSQFNLDKRTEKKSNRLTLSLTPLSRLDKFKLSQILQPLLTDSRIMTDVQIGAQKGLLDTKESAYKILRFHWRYLYRFLSSYWEFYRNVKPKPLEICLSS